MMKKQEYEKIINESQFLIVEFGNNLCSACASIRSKIEEWCSDHKEVKYIYVDCMESPEIAASESIFSSPAVLVFVEGKLTLRESGYFGIARIFERIEEYIDLIKDNEE